MGRLLFTTGLVQLGCYELVGQELSAAQALLFHLCFWLWIERNDEWRSVCYGRVDLELQGRQGMAGKPSTALSHHHLFVCEMNEQDPLA